MTGGTATRVGRPPRFSLGQWGAMSLFACCQFLVIVDTAGFNVALASIGHDFSVPVNQTGAVNLGFVVALAVMLPMSGWLGERFGPRRILIASMCVLILGSAACAGAVSLPMVVAGRVLQGIAAGGLQPLAASLLYRQFEPSQRLRVTAALSLPISLAPALGPLIGGVFVQELSWRWVFLLNVPISAAALIVGVLCVREVEDRAARALDIRGAVLTVIGIGAAVLGLQGLSSGTGAASVVAGAVVLAVGVAAIAVLVPVERRAGKGAFLDLKLLEIRTFAKSTWITAAHSAGFMGFGLAGPLLLQTELGFGAFTAGLVGAVGALGPMLLGQSARRFVLRVGPRAAIACSQFGLVTGLGLVVLGYAALPHWVIPIGVFINGASSFVTVISCQTVGFAAVPQVNLGDATALNGTSRQLGSAVAIAAVSGALAGAAGLHASAAATAAITLGTLAVFHGLALVVVAGAGRLPLPTQGGEAAR